MVRFLKSFSYTFGQNKGASIIEVIIASAIGLVMMLAFGHFLMSQISASQNIAHTFEIAALRSRIVETLSETTGCTRNFGNANPNTALNYASLLNRAGNASYSVNQNFGNGLLSITSIRRNAANPIVGPNSKGNFTLTVTANKRGKLLGLKTVPINIPIYFLTDAASRIQSCSTQGISSEIQCVTQQNTCAGCTTLTVTCPNGYKLTGGGCEDDDVSKSSYRNHPLPPGGAYPNGGWQCYSSNGGNLISSAVCCL